MLCYPRVRIGSGTLHCPLPFALSVPLVLFPFLSCFVLLCLLWVGKCGGVCSIAAVLLLLCCAVQYCRVVVVCVVSL